MPKPPTNSTDGSLVLWSSELSPYALKLRAMLDFTGDAYRCLPMQGGRVENARFAARLAWAKRHRQVARFPALTPLDEYPLVPYLFDAHAAPGAAQFWYDSSGLATWLDRRADRQAAPLVPADAQLAFIAHWIDEAFDELGLYLVHHQRWVQSARTNTAGSRLADEFSRLLPPMAARLLGARFARRQVRRLPYLFSVAEADTHFADLPPGLRPPRRQGFPPTHAFLESTWVALLAALESLLSAQPFVLGNRFTLADASIYGQLGMNLTDPTSAERMQALAPVCYRWLCAIRDGTHAVTRDAAPKEMSGSGLQLTNNLRPLLALIGDTFVPLMQQNEAAWRTAVAAGQTRFNEAAFNRGEALYDGEIAGYRFRSVVKSFQVQVWQDLKGAWRALSEADRCALRECLSVRACHALATV